MTFAIILEVGNSVRLCYRLFLVEILFSALLEKILISS